MDMHIFIFFEFNYIKSLTGLNTKVDTAKLCYFGLKQSNFVLKLREIW